MNPLHQRRPTSSPTSSHPGDDLPKSTSSRRPYPERDDVDLRPSEHTPTSTPAARPRDDHNASWPAPTRNDHTAPWAAHTRTTTCPTCGAPPGAHCVNLDSRTPTDYLHRQRVIAAGPMPVDGRP